MHDRHRVLERAAMTMGWVGGLITGGFSWLRRQFHREPRVLSRAEKKQRRKELSRKPRKAA